MRIVVSGTHASGKSTLIADFCQRHPEYTVFADPFESLDEADDRPGAAMFAAQLRIAADRLMHEEEPRLIAERSPLDFLAYLRALSELRGRGHHDVDAEDRATDLTAAALRSVDLLIVLPLSPTDPIFVADDEDRELRDAMNDALLDLIDEGDVLGDDLIVEEITGTPAERLARLESLVRSGRVRR